MHVTVGQLSILYSFNNFLQFVVKHYAYQSYGILNLDIVSNEHFFYHMLPYRMLFRVVRYSFVASYLQVF